MKVHNFFSRAAIVAIAIPAAAIIAVLPASSALAEVVVEYAADGVASFSINAVTDAAEIWVELESPTIAAADVALTVNGVDVPMSATPLGAIAVIAPSVDPLALTLFLDQSASPDLAITVLDASGGILFSDSARLTFGEGDPPADPDDGSSGPGGDGDPDDPGSPLAVTGETLTGLIIACFIALALGVVGFVFIRTSRERQKS